MKMEMLSCGPLAGIAIIVLTLLCVALAWMYLSLHRKNRLLYRQAEDTFRIKGAADHLLQSLPEAQLTQDQLLFKRLTELLQEGEVFRDQQLDREKLAKMLGTNRTYLSSAVKSITGGLPIRDYVNSYRLRYAAQLLVNEKDLPVTTVGERAGFKTTSTFYRSFKDRFGMLPSEYRKYSALK